MYTNLPGWRTKRKIVVIESDDWGSIRMPSREVYQKCLNAGYPVDRIAYERYDTLLSQDDLELLFNLLKTFKDKNGNNPVFTANCVVANPDFERIRKDDFKKYYYELITDTFKRYPEHTKNFSLWNEGITNRIFFPQYHAREHLNVSLFMDALQKGNEAVHFGFENEMPGNLTLGPEGLGNYFVEATKYSSLRDKEEKLKVYLEGLDIFEKLFKYKSRTIIPPNYIWSPDHNNAVLEKEVNIFQGIRKICEPVPGQKSIYHNVYLGKKNKFGQIYLVRNSIFEPSLFNSGIRDHVGRCLGDMSIAFSMNKPAIIASHRINYAGFVDEKNRDRSLVLLKQLLTEALRRWPDIEFMTSLQLSKLITEV